MKPFLKKSIKYIIITAIIVLSIWAVLHNIELSEFVKILETIKWRYCIYAGLVSILSHWVRAVRWKIYLEPIKKPTSYINLFSAVMVGYAVNNITPRIGEVVRPFIYAERENISKSAVFGTIIVERFVDVVFLMLMFAVVFLFSRSLISIAFPWLTSSMLTLMLLIISTAALILFIMLSTNLFDRLLNVVVKKILPKYYEKINSIWQSFKQGFASFKKPKNYLKNFIYSALIWLLYATPTYILFFAFNFQNKLDLGFGDACLLIIVTGVGSTIAPTPGAIGVYHWLIVAALTHLYPTISKEEALAYATVNHALNLLIQIIIGTGFMVREGLSLKKIFSKKELEIINSAD